MGCLRNFVCTELISVAPDETLYTLVKFFDDLVAFTVNEHSKDVASRFSNSPFNSSSPLIATVSSTVVSSPTVSSSTVSSLTVSSPTVFSPTVSSPTVFSPTVSSPTVSSPTVSSPAVSSPTVSSKSTTTSSTVIISSQSSSSTNSKLVGLNISQYTSRFDRSPVNMTRTEAKLRQMNKLWISLLEEHFGSISAFEQLLSQTGTSTMNQIDYSQQLEEKYNQGFVDGIKFTQEKIQQKYDDDVLKLIYGCSQTSADYDKWRFTLSYEQTNNFKSKYKDSIQMEDKLKIS